MSAHEPRGGYTCNCSLFDQQMALVRRRMPPRVCPRCWYLEVRAALELQYDREPDGWFLRIAQRLGLNPESGRVILDIEDGVQGLFDAVQTLIRTSRHTCRPEPM